MKGLEIYEPVGKVTLTGLDDISVNLRGQLGEAVYFWSFSTRPSTPISFQFTRSWVT